MNEDVMDMRDVKVTNNVYLCVFVSECVCVSM